MRLTLRALLVAILAGFYVVAAGEHAERVNTFKARGDQSGYLWDAQNVYANWHGRQPPVVIGERNRMPVYAGFLAALWRPGISDDEFFARAKRWNIYLSVVLLAVLWVVLRTYLAELAAFNLTLTVGFGYFIFKAGYVQAELLFYFLFFVAFVLCLDVLGSRHRGLALISRAAATGLIAAVAHLTKAAMLPFAAIFVVVIGAASVMQRRGPDYRRDTLAAAAVFVLVFLAILAPYLRTNKRVFGHYFYNVNTTFYIWYDDWPQASVGTILHGDGVGWPSMPADQLPSARRYWREHSVAQIAARIGGGFRDMAVRSYQTFWYFKYVVLYGLLAVGVVFRQRARVRAVVVEHAPQVAFLMLYCVAYLFGVAFYAPISGTGTTRFLLAHVLPLLFVCARLAARPPFALSEWRVHGTTVSLRHVDLLITVLLALDIAFVVWPRLMSTYGGF